MVVGFWLEITMQDGDKELADSIIDWCRTSLQERTALLHTRKKQTESDD